MSDAREYLTDAASGVIDIEVSVVAMHDALLAVLDLHEEDGPSGHGWCAACSASQDLAVSWPCLTVRAIDKTLGVGDE